jgi:hypothetical protein
LGISQSELVQVLVVGTGFLGSLLFWELNFSLWDCIIMVNRILGKRPGYLRQLGGVWGVGVNIYFRGSYSTSC